MIQRPSGSRPRRQRKDKVVKDAVDGESETGRESSSHSGHARDRGDRPRRRRSRERGERDRDHRRSTGKTGDSSRNDRDNKDAGKWKKGEDGKHDSPLAANGTVHPKQHGGALILQDGGKSYSRDFSSRDGRQHHDHSHLFADDPRMASLMRRIYRDDDRERRSNAFSQLQEHLQHPDNKQSVTKLADSILIALQDLFYDRVSAEVKQEVARCVGLVGAALGYESQRFFQWVFAKVGTAPSDDLKVLFLQALHQAFKIDCERQQFQEFVPMAMSNLQSVLENADTPDLLMAVVDCIQYVAEYYPHVFTNHFRDTVDILVGWHIDSTQKETVIKYTSDILVSLQQFWVGDLGFSVTLLGQFLEDMEAYTEDLHRFARRSPCEDDVPPPDVCLPKLTALLRVFSTVVSSMGDHFSPNHGPPLTEAYITELLDRMVRCVDQVTTDHPSEELFIAANTCVCLLGQGLGSGLAQSCSGALSYTTKQTEQSMLSSTHSISALRLLNKILELVNTSLPVSVIEQILGPGSKFLQLRFYTNPEVLPSVLKVYRSLLTLKNIPLLDMVYRLVLGDLEVAINTLLSCNGLPPSCSVVKNNPFASSVYAEQQALTVAVFNMCGLAEIGNAKNSIIGMWGLSPSFFELFATHLKPCHLHLAVSHPAVQYTALYTLLSHCTRHGHFISSSLASGAPPPTIMEGVSLSTGGHFATILGLLAELLPSSNMSGDSRNLCLRWTQEIVQQLQRADNPHLFSMPEYQATCRGLLPLACSPDSGTCLPAVQLLQQMVQLGHLPHDFLGRCVDVCKLLLTRTDRGVQQACTSLLTLLPIALVITEKDYSDPQPVPHRRATLQQELELQQEARHSHMAKAPSGTFHSHNFRTVMAFLLNSTKPGNLVADKWVERIFHSCQRSRKKDGGLGSDEDKVIQDRECLQKLFQDNTSLLWFWAMWEAAAFCVLAKLRTPLGRAQETFQTIEVAVRTYAAEARSRDSDENKGSKTDDTKLSGLGGKHYTAQLQVHLLLQFLENLDKFMYNAYEGCAVAMSAPPKTVRTFFRTNRATCLEWLNRIRLSIMTIALHCGQPAAALRHGYELLWDMKDNNNTQGSEFEHAVVLVVQALSELRCPDAIVGMLAWCRDVIGRNMPWINAIKEQAGGRYEAAVKEYHHGLQLYLGLTSLPVTSEPQANTDSSLPSPPNSPRSQGLSSNTPGEDGVGSPKLTVLHKPVDPSPEVVEFMIKQMAECYISLADWSSVEDWQHGVQKLRMDNTNSHLQRAFNTDVDLNYIKALSKFEEVDLPGVKEHLELVPGASLSGLEDAAEKPDFSCSPAWDSRQLLQITEQQLVRAATHICLVPGVGSRDESHRSGVSAVLKHAAKLSDNFLQLSASEWPTCLPHDHTINFYWAKTLQAMVATDSQEWPVHSMAELTLEPSQHNVRTCHRMMWYLQHQLHVLQDREGLAGGITEHLSHLRLATLRLARKQANFQLAQKVLLDHVDLLQGQAQENATMVPTQVYSQTRTGPQTILNALSTVESVPVLTNPLRLKLERESAKILQTMGHSSEAWETLSSCVATYGPLALDKPPTKTARETGELVSRSLLTLVKWLQADWKTSASYLKLASKADEGSLIPRLTRNVQVLLELEERGVRQGKGILNTAAALVQRRGTSHVMSEAELTCGRLVHLSTMQCPHLSKAWSSLAAWSYKWGRKVVDVASTAGSVDLTADDKAEILQVLPAGIGAEEVDMVFTIISQAHCSASGMQEEDISDNIQFPYHDSAETTRRQLLTSCPTLQTAGQDVVDLLLEIWRRICDGLFSHYHLACKAYFQYLKLNGEPCSAESFSNEDGNVTATLRLLRLLVKHAGELRVELEEGLAKTPTAPWKGIIPQLFSRLNHPEGYVRQSISDLLCRVAQDSPHLIVYPAVVGCSSVATDKKNPAKEGPGEMLSTILAESAADNAKEDGEETEDNSQSQDEEDEEANTDLRNCFSAIVDTLSKHNPSMVSQVQTMVSELRRVTLLWEELWFGALNQHHGDITRRIHQLEDEVKRVLSNATLSHEEKSAIILEKHNAILKPTVFAMEHLKAITDQPGETPHERWFQDTYEKHIEEALNKLKNPPNPSTPQNSWVMFKQLHHVLQQRAQKRSTSVLKLDEISPKLAEMADTVIALPGSSLSTSQQDVTISGFCNTVTILPTKTKPKKIMLMGSDGKRYTYLFKGLEDLHLDERIMQFLSIVNNMFAKVNRHQSPRYHARHYSVTPLGPRSGLIQWVDGATPLFGLYKRWQQREATIAAMKQQGSSSSGGSTQGLNTAPIMRPSELYYSKITPLLKEKGVTDLSNRKEWPNSVQKEVLCELVRETPRDLLARELWCSCSSAVEWWRVTQLYCRSTAVMSMVGYIIGLGDRHLDNILIDLNTGEVVHIDYNVCFEKGKGLRVPERVPFRMTQNIEAGLGPNGVEGLFRLSSEQVLKLMRKGRETLLTLLEAFVYDPLVDWTTGHEGGYVGAVYGGGQTSTNDARQSRKEMEKEITRSLFSSRVAEMKVNWFKNRDEMVSALPRLQETLEEHLESQRQLQHVCSSNSSLLQQKCLLEAALQDQHHSLHSLQHRYTEHQKVLQVRNMVQEAIQEKLNECDHWTKQHQWALAILKGPQLSQLCSEVSTRLDLGVPSYVSAISFLQNAGQGHTVTQCEQVDSELSQMLYQRRTVLHSCLEVLSTYSTVVAQFPESYRELNRFHSWHHWLQELICDFSSHRCQEILSLFESRFGGKDIASHTLTSHLVSNTEFKLQSFITETNAKLLKVLNLLYERRSHECHESSSLVTAVKDTSSNIQQFIIDNGVSGVSSLTCVVVTALCALNRRCLVMEGAAAAAGDRLMDLTSRDGDWFLDELCSMSGNVTQLITVLKEHPLLQCAVSEVAQNSMNAVFTAHKVYTSLQELNGNFRSIILPEAMKLIQCEDPSAMALLDGLEGLIEDTRMPLDALVSSLQVHLRKLTVGLEVDDYNDVLVIAETLRQKYERLLHPEETDTAENGLRPVTPNMTSGQMLLVGFNGLFTTVETELSSLLHLLDTLQVPAEWRKVDVVREARGMQASVFGEMTTQLLWDIFLVKRLQAMQDYFNLCKNMAASLTATTYDSTPPSPGLPNGHLSPSHAGKASPDGPMHLHTDDQLVKPIKRYIADFVRQLVIGYPSQSLGYTLCTFINALGVDVVAEVNAKDVGAESRVSIDDLAKLAVDHNLRTNSFTQPLLAQASALTSSHDIAWRKHDLVRRLDVNINQCKASVQRAQLQLARYQWYHEDTLLQTVHHSGSSSLVAPSRASVMSDLRKYVQTLVQLDSAVGSVQERSTQLEAGIAQRLKWAAGANPSLQTMLLDFEEAQNNRNSLLMNEGRRASDVCKLCNAVLHFEALRTRTPEAMQADATFLALIRRCEESSRLLESCTTTVADMEQALIQMLPPSLEQPIGESWFHTLHQLVVQEMSVQQSRAAEQEMGVETTREQLKSEVSSVKGILTVHHKLLSDVKIMLKSMAKEDEASDADQQEESSRIRQFMGGYRTYSEMFTSLLMNILQGCSGEESASQLSQVGPTITFLIDQTHMIYDELVSFATPLVTSRESTEAQTPFATVATSQKKADRNSSPGPSGRTVSLLQKDSRTSGTPPGFGKGPGTPKKTAAAIRDPRTGKALQERNSYAVSVWRRVKAKLDGRDIDASRRMPIAEQVDFVIKEATSTENLALLYEGWTPWV
ncbi:Serine/threonine-protein kinase smg1 [Branchiostoma belcheri]|nr:Serine/threonine-protein kinase smg1 [Branchiostoma belcheri]